MNGTLGKLGLSCLSRILGIYCMADPGQCSNRLLFGLMGNLDPFDSMGMHMWVSDEKVQSTIYYDESEIGGGQTDTESLNFIVSQGGQQQSGILSQLGASISSAYGTALGALGQVFRGRPPGQSFAACVGQNMSRTFTGSPDSPIITTVTAGATGIVGSVLSFVHVPGGGGQVPLSAFLTAWAAGLGGAGAEGITAAAGVAWDIAPGLGLVGLAPLVGSAANCASVGVAP